MKQRFVPKLRCTKDYSIFALHPFNRDIDPHRLRELQRLMRKNGFDPRFPIACIYKGRGKHIIVAGHHRFEVAVALGLPIWFIDYPTESDIADKEIIDGHWDLEDFLKAWAKTGGEDAQDVLNFSKATGVPYMLAASILSGGPRGTSNVSKRIKQKTYSATNRRYAAEVKRAILFCKEQGVDFAGTTGFAGALARLILVPEFDLDYLLRKIKAHRRAIERCRSIEDYLIMLEGIYNSHTKRRYRVNLVFRVDQMMEERNPIRRQSSNS